MAALTDTVAASQRVHDLCKVARSLWAQDRSKLAIETAWSAFDLDSSDGDVKRALVALLMNFPSELSSERRQAFLGLLCDREIDPSDLGPAGWDLVLRDPAFAEDVTEDAAFERLAGTVGSDELALALLREAPVSSPRAERSLTRLRRWLLLSGTWRLHPGLVSALTTQASLNGGAWPFDETERAALEVAKGAPAAMYRARPLVTKPVEAGDADPVTKAVTTQYEGWPYPVWTRVTRPRARRLPDVIRRMCPSAVQHLPVNARMLIAGCGTGRQAAALAFAYPDASVTAIDVSQASLDYAQRQCASLGLRHIEFRKLDLHDAAQLGQQFDMIFCAGVLHHLPDPERGWEAITDVLRPGGVMNIAVYSRVARLFIAGARTLISDLTHQPVSDDLLREVRRRFLERAEQPLAAAIASGPEFATLAGIHDLLLHRHEDPFDVSRIEIALKRLGLRLLSFMLPSPLHVAQYNAMFPGDPQRRDFDSWRAFEVRHPRAFAGMCQFWCLKDAGANPS